MKSKKSNTSKDPKNPDAIDDNAELDQLVKKTKIQHKVLKKMIEEINKSIDNK